MRNPLEFAEIYDEWEQSLPPPEREWCRRALRNAAELENVAEVSAKELVIQTLLFCQGLLPTL